MFRTAMAAIIDLPVGLSFVTEYTPLAAPEADCPSGTYLAVEEQTLRRSDQTLVLELDVTVASDGELATEGRLSLGE